jgi:hypothetical protein
MLPSSMIVTCDGPTEPPLVVAAYVLETKCIRSAEAPDGGAEGGATWDRTGVELWLSAGDAGAPDSIFARYRGV